jgi:hypothetical protein
MIHYDILGMFGGNTISRRHTRIKIYDEYEIRKEDGFEYIRVTNFDWLFKSHSRGDSFFRMMLFIYETE